MDNLTLKVSKRDTLGKKTRFLRRRGITPVHLFGHNIESQTLQGDAAKLERLIAQAGTTRLITLDVEEDKEPRSVFIREIQRNAYRRELLHVDFYQVRKGEKVKIEVPIVFVGEAPAIKQGYTLAHGVNSLTLECLPDCLPQQIPVDLSHLEELEQAIYVRDIVLSPDVTVMTDPDQLIVKVKAVKAHEEEVVAKVEAEAPPAEAAPEEAPKETPESESK